jgi:hypothetical protein
MQNGKRSALSFQPSAALYTDDASGTQQDALVAYVALFGIRKLKADGWRLNASVLKIAQDLWVALA